MTTLPIPTQTHALGKVAIAISIALFLITVALFSPVRHYDFLNFDDPEYVTDNPNVMGGLTLPSIKWAFTNVNSSNWHPLTWLSHMIDVQIWGLRPGGHHLTNVVLHCINAVLLFLLFGRITGAKWPSAFVAAVFAWHPIHVESVAWISERKDVLSTLFWISSIWAYVRFVQTRKRSGYWLAGILFACALMSKPMVVTLPILLLLLDYWPLQRATLSRADASKWRNLFIEKIPLAVLSAGCIALTVWAQHSIGAFRSFQQVPFRLRVLNVPVSYLNYLNETIWPAKLAPFYPYSSAIPIWQATSATAILLAITVFVLSFARKYPYLFVGWIWFLVGLIPVIGVIQVGDQSMADRYMYTPLIGLSIAISWGVADLSEKLRFNRKAVAVAALIVLTACGIATANQLPNWRDNFALYRSALTPAHTTSGHPFFFDGLADALFRAGRLSEADEVVTQGLQKFPENTKRLNLAGKIKFQRGDTDEAERLWRRALELNADEWDAHNNLGILYARRQQWDQARLHFERLIQLRPDDVVALGNLAQLCFLTKDYAAALRYCDKGLTLSPNDPMLRALKPKIEQQQWNER